MNPYMIRKLAVHNQTDAHRIVCRSESCWATGRRLLLSLNGGKNAAVLKIPEEQSVRSSTELPLRPRKRAANGLWKTCGNVRNVFYARSVFLLDRLTQMSHGRCARIRLADLVNGRSSPCNSSFSMIAGEQHEGKPEMLKPRAGEPASRSTSKLDSASIGIRDWPNPSDLDEACHGWGSNEQAPVRIPGAVGGSAWGKICRGTWEALLSGEEPTWNGNQ